MPEANESFAAERNERCPFLGNPFDDCFIVGISSQTIEQAIYYCGENFEECEIYKRGTKHIV